VEDLGVPLLGQVEVLLVKGGEAREGAAVAQGAEAAGTNWVAITAGFSMAIASGLCALGQAKATASAAEALGRNPAARPGIQLALILGLALIESLALYTLAIIIVKVK